jgi:hypothetical protein
MHRDAQVELIILILQMLKKLKCINSSTYMTCIDSSFLRKLRYLNNEMRGPSIANTLNADGANNPLIMNEKNARTTSIHANNNKLIIKPDATNDIDKREKARKKARKEELKAANNEFKKKQSKSMSFSVMSNHNRSNSRSSTLNSKKCCCCVCLFGNQKNDFFVETGRQSKAFSALKRNSLNSPPNGEAVAGHTSTTATPSSSDLPEVTHLQLTRKREKSVTDFIQIHKETVSSLKLSSKSSSFDATATADADDNKPDVVTEINVTTTTISNSQSNVSPE